MTPARKKRLALIVLMVAGVAVGVGFALNSLNQNIMFFLTPSEVLVARPGDGLTVHFDLTDNERQVTVRYTGILPDLFREGQGIIANGRLDENGAIVAEEVLAKHDENYMPPELAGMHKPEGVVQ